MKSDSFIQFCKYSWNNHTKMTVRSVTFYIVLTIVSLRSSKPGSQETNNEKSAEANEEGGSNLKAARITTHALCYIISISSITYLLYLIRVSIRSLSKPFELSGHTSTERKHRNSYFQAIDPQIQIKRKKMIECLEDIVRLYLKTLLDPLIISGTINIGYIVIKNVNIRSLYHDFIVLAFFDLYLVAMGIVLMQLVSVHCFCGMLDKISNLHLKISGIFNWNVEWDPLLVEEMLKPSDKMLPVCKALKILQWMIYFSVVSIFVICVAQFT